MHIRFDKVDGFIILHYGTRYLVLFGNKRYDFICNRIRNIKRVKSNVTYVISHNYAKLIHAIPCFLQKLWHFIMLYYSLSQFLIKIKITTAVTCS